MVLQQLAEVVDPSVSPARAAVHQLGDQRGHRRVERDELLPALGDADLFGDAAGEYASLGEGGIA